MIDKTALEQVINEALEGTKMFLVTLQVTKDNVIDVALDSDEDITIDDCVAVNDAVLAAFDRDEAAGRLRAAVSAAAASSENGGKNNRQYHQKRRNAGCDFALQCTQEGKERKFL